MKPLLIRKPKTVQATPSQPIHSLSPETLESIFKEVLNDLNNRTLAGLLGEANPSMLAQVQETQARVDSIWKDCLQGKATLESFKEAVRVWHGAVIALFTPPQARWQKVGQERLFNP